MLFALGKNGGMAEWFKAAVLKTASPKGDVGSNPTPSAMHQRRVHGSPELDVVQGAIESCTTR